MSRPRLLDLFCGAGGSSTGYHRAGFDVIGIDIEPQPNYPFEFIQADALQPPVDLADFDAIHASPPCQFATAYRRRPGVATTARSLIAETRRLLQDTGKPYVIENVDQAAARDELIDPIRLCGSSFGLDVRRHRLFETSWPATPLDCDHSWQTPRFPPATNRTNLRSTVEVGVWRIPLDVQQAAMGIDWMTRSELSQAIPPAYCQFIGEQLMQHLSGDGERDGSSHGRTRGTSVSPGRRTGCHLSTDGPPGSVSSERSHPSEFAAIAACSPELSRGRDGQG